MKLRALLCLLCLLLLPASLAAYPDRDFLLHEMDRLEAYLRKAQAADGPLCVPDSLARAQALLAAAREEFDEGDYWEAEDAIRLCRDASENLWEEILSCGKDLDRDGLPDRADRCPETPETFNGYMDDDGCPDRMPRRAILSPDRIELLEPVRFDDDATQPVGGPDSVLHEVARLLKENPDLRIRVEAHLDGRVPPQEADRITAARAESVKDLLVSLGVAESRLQAEGKGGREPVASNDSAFGRRLNRRIELIRIP